MVGRYCSYLLPKQARGTPQILIFETLGMIGRPALYTKKELIINLTNVRILAVFTRNSRLTVAKIYNSTYLCGTKNELLIFSFTTLGHHTL